MYRKLPPLPTSRLPFLLLVDWVECLSFKQICRVYQLYVLSAGLGPVVYYWVCILKWGVIYS